MTPVLTILALCWAFFFLFYLASAVMYSFNVKYYMDRMIKFSPILAENGKSKWYNILIMLGSSLAAAAGAYALWFGLWWGIVMVLIVSGNEAYRGMGYYMDYGKKTGDFYQAKVHMVLHSLIVGYAIAYVVFISFSGGAELWVASIVKLITGL